MQPLHQSDGECTKLIDISNLISLLAILVQVQGHYTAALCRGQASWGEFSNCYFPLKAGARFSRNAFTPSRKSSVPLAAF